MALIRISRPVASRPESHQHSLAAARSPKNATTKQRMARKVRTKKGRAVYAHRKAIVEPVFGQIDTVQNGRRLLLRGEPAARDQWSFACAVHNLLKLHRNGGLGLLSPG
jgi:hypothetical protein